MLDLLQLPLHWQIHAHKMMIGLLLNGGQQRANLLLKEAQLTVLVEEGIKCLVEAEEVQLLLEAQEVECWVEVEVEVEEAKEVKILSSRNYLPV